jgi:5,5'-dehydrodivanillate O-demethylase
MLTIAENERLTRVGPGTPMGNLLRRYWFAVGCSMLVTNKPRRVKLLGEDLVLYRGASGETVLMQLRCAHRGVALDHGRVEGDSIRCPYHGWLYDRGGKCVLQPAELNEDGSKVRLTAYKTQEISGIVFAYMGPDPAPLLPLYDLLLAEGDKKVLVQQFDTNWFQSIENILDVAHFSWLHGYTFPRFSGKKPRYRFERAEYGMNIELGVDESPPDVTPYAFPSINRFALPPAKPGGPLTEVLMLRSPVDDSSHKNYFLMCNPSETPAAGATKGVYAIEQHPKFGEYAALPNDWWGIDVSDQDRMVAEQAGVVVDRTKEHLVATDIGIVQMRRLMREAIEAVEKGEDPIGIIRDPAKQKVQFRLHMSTSKDDRTTDTDYTLGAKA